MSSNLSVRNHALYIVTHEPTGAQYVGLTVITGRAVKRSIRERWRKHLSRARHENRDWRLCIALRTYNAADFIVTLHSVVRGRRAAHAAERALIAALKPELNTR